MWQWSHAEFDHRYRYSIFISVVYLQDAFGEGYKH